MTMGEFQGMLPHERTVYVCENHAEVRYHSHMADGNLAAMKRHEATEEDLIFHREYYQDHRRLLAEKLAECREEVQDLGAEEAFKYYQEMEGGYHWDTTFFSW